MKTNTITTKPNTISVFNLLKTTFINHFDREPNNLNKNVTTRPLIKKTPIN